MPRVSTIVTFSLGAAAGWAVRGYLLALARASNGRKRPSVRRPTVATVEESVRMEASLETPGSPELQGDHLQKLWKAADTALAIAYAAARRAQTSDMDQLLDQRRALADLMLDRALDLAPPALAILDQRTADLVRTAEEMRTATGRIEDASKVLGAVSSLVALLR